MDTQQHPDDEAIVTAAHDLVDAVALVHRINQAWTHGRTLNGLLKVAMDGLRSRAKHHASACMRELTVLSRRARGILPHGQNGALPWRPLYPSGTRPYTELDELQGQLVRYEDMIAETGDDAATAPSLGESMGG